MEKYFGAAAFVINNREILMMLRESDAKRFPNRWGLVGGKSEEGETSEETVRRELSEEISIIPKVIVDIGELPDLYNSGRLFRCFYCPIDNEERANIKKGSEGEKLGFFSFEKALVLDPIGPVFSDPNRLEKLKDLINEGITIEFS